MNRGPSGGRELRQLLETIEAVRAEQHGRPLGILPALRDVLDIDAAFMARPVESANGWRLESLETEGIRSPARLRRVLSEQLQRPHPASWLGLRHAPEACNLTEEVPSDGDVGPTLLTPLGLDGHHLARAFICENDTVLAWIVILSRTLITQEQLQTFDTVASALRERLRIERALGGAPRIHAALTTTLQQITSPALLVDARSRITETNRAARELLATQRTEVMTSIGALQAGQRPTLPFTLTKLSAGGSTEQFLAVLHPRSTEARLALFVTLASTRWSLTPRQTDVLMLLVRGDSNATIAEKLGVSDRTAEIHISAIFERAGVGNRVQLVVAVLLG